MLVRRGSHAPWLLSAPGVTAGPAAFPSWSGGCWRAWAEGSPQRVVTVSDSCGPAIQGSCQPRGRSPRGHIAGRPGGCMCPCHGPSGLSRRPKTSWALQLRGAVVGGAPGHLGQALCTQSRLSLQSGLVPGAPLEGPLWLGRGVSSVLGAPRPHALGSSAGRLPCAGAALVPGGPALPCPARCVLVECSPLSLVSNLPGPASPGGHPPPCWLLRRTWPRCISHCSLTAICTESFLAVGFLWLEPYIQGSSQTTEAAGASSVLILDPWALRIAAAVPRAGGALRFRRKMTVRPTRKGVSVTASVSASDRGLGGRGCACRAMNGP